MLQEIKEQINAIKKSEKKSLPIGGDTFTFEMAIDGADKSLFMDKTPLMNSFGGKFGEVEVEKGKIITCVSLPKYVRDDNIIPFSITDVILLEVLRNDVEQTLKKALHEIVDDSTDVMCSKAKTIECNITMQVVGKSTCSQVLNLINRCFHEGTNVVYQRASPKCKYDKENETVIIRKRNYYALKCYNKSLQQRREGNCYVKEGLLRIEIIMQERTIEKLFCKKSTIQDVLTAHGLMKIIEEYKRIFNCEIIREHIEPGLSEVKEILFISLIETNSQKETVALKKELIMDEEIFRKALINWYEYGGQSKESAKRNAATYICRNKEKYGFPENVIDTMRKFGKLCK